MLARLVTFGLIIFTEEVWKESRRYLAEDHNPAQKLQQGL